MGQSSQQNTRKKTIAFLVGVLLGFLLVWFFLQKETPEVPLPVEEIAEDKTQSTVVQLTSDMAVYQDGEQIGTLHADTLLLHETGQEEQGVEHFSLDPELFVAVRDLLDFFPVF